MFLPSATAFDVRRGRGEAKHWQMPRKSILKSFSAGMITQLDEAQASTMINEETTLVEQDRQNHTIQIMDRRQSLHHSASESQTHTYGSLRQSMSSVTMVGRPSLGGRRVSFAPSAHVR